METKTSVQKVSQENHLVRRAREALSVAYTAEEVASMTLHKALRTWERMVIAEADAFQRSHAHFHG